MEKFKINNKLDLKQLKSNYKKNKAVVIEGFLDKESADKLYNFLAFQMPEDWWYTSYMIPSISKKPGYVRRNPENIATINELYPKAYKDFWLRKFTYIFDRGTTHIETCNCMECEYKKFLQTEEVRNFIKKITGLKMSMNGEIFASRYTSGQFLSPHHDEYKGTLSLVYSLSKGWKPEWGGNLYLLEDDYKTIKKVILSSYNRLALTYMNSPDRKEIGTPHFVSQIAGGIKQPRLSLTGWIS